MTRLCLPGLAGVLRRLSGSAVSVSRSAGANCDAVVTADGLGTSRQSSGARFAASVRAMLPISVVVCAVVVSGGQPAHAGLLESVYHNIPTTDYYPTDASIAANQSYVAANASNYTFINTNDGFQYDESSGTTTNTFLGADASGAALSDTAIIDYTAITAAGSIVITTAGDYTFNLSAADDAARVYLGGTLIAENSFNGGLSVPSSATETLAAGSYAFDLFYFQQSGGAFLNFTVTGPGAVAYALPASVPEPESLMLLGVGLLAMAVVQGRKRGATAFGEVK